jgi:hypothetical protein
MDPLGDAAVKTIFDQGDLEAVSALMGTLIRNDGIPSKDMPPAISEYIEKASPLPPWADREKMLLGEKVFVRYGAQMGLGIIGYSLPMEYASWTLSHVLGMTQELEVHVVRRVYETIVWGVRCLAPGGLTTPNGQGIITTLKARLMHSTIRRLILSGNKQVPVVKNSLANLAQSLQWDMSWGAPVNQVDQAYVLQTLSLMPFEQLGIADLTREEKEALLHAWNVAGYYLGIERVLMPDDLDEAHDLYAKFQSMQLKPTPQGVALTAALQLIYGNIVGKRHAELAWRTVLRALLPQNVAAMVGVAEGKVSWFWELITVAERKCSDLLSKVEEDNKVTQEVSSWLGKELLTHTYTLTRSGERRAFDLPESLAQSWDISLPAGVKA